MRIGLIKKPHITEKATDLGSQNKYVFEVDKNANKNEIKKEIERIYKVNVVKVNILKIPSKPKRFGNIVSKKDKYKKAIVTLKEGQKIELV
jgi:large subunit ribosomal protein L23